jgi:hypothetical protein
MGQVRNAYRILVGDIGVEERIIFELISKKYVARRGLDSSGSAQRPVVGSCEYGNELWGSIKG